MAVSGSESGGKITLRFGGDILGTTMTGTINSTSMVPDTSSSTGPAQDTFAPGTQTQFTHAVGALRADAVKQQKAAAQRQAAVAQSQAQADYDKAAQAIPGDVRAVQQAVAALTQASAAEAAAMGTFRSDTAAAVRTGCSNSAAATTAVAAGSDKINNLLGDTGQAAAAINQVTPALSSDLDGLQDPAAGVHASVTDSEFAADMTTLGSANEAATGAVATTSADGDEENTLYNQIYDQPWC